MLWVNVFSVLCVFCFCNAVRCLAELLIQPSTMEGRHLLKMEVQVETAGWSFLFMDRRNDVQSDI